jgi:chain length determinant protein EpsF
MSFHQFLLVLRARWFTVAGLLVAAMLATAVITYLQPRLYTASAAVVIDAKTDPIAGIVYPEQLLSSYMATQVDIISSERVALQVVRNLKLDQDVEFRQQWQKSTGGRGTFPDWLAANLQRALTAAPSRESNVVNISVTWPDSKAAAALANAFAQAYIDTTIELKVEPARQYANWFDERSRALRDDLKAKQKRLSDYQNATGLVATDERLDIENARLNELSSELVSIQEQRDDSQSRQRQGHSADVESLPEVLQSSMVSGLKADLSRAEAERQDIAARLGKNHPDYQTNAAEIARLRERIAEESAKVVASLGSTTQVNRRRESDITADLEAQKKRILDLRQQHDEAADLQFDVQTAQRNLDAVMQRLAMSNLESQTQQTNVVLLTPAVEPLVRSSPRLPLNAAIGLFFGILLGVGTALLLEIKNRRIRGDDELPALLGVPLLGSFGAVKVAKPRARATRSAPPSDSVVT